MNDEMKKFLADIPSQDKPVADSLDEKPKETAEVVPEKEAEEEEDVEEGRKNRRHRRLEEKLKAKDEMLFALNDRVIELSEEARFRAQAGEEGVDPDLLRVFGANDQGKEIAAIMQRKIADASQIAEERALKAFEQRQRESVEEQKQYESLIDSNLESLEDTYDVDLTSDAPKARKARREFLELVQDLSPKDDEGNVTGYADFESTFEIYQSRQTKPDASRQKELASRSMQNSSSAGTDKATQDATLAYLREQGIRI